MIVEKETIGVYGIDVLVQIGWLKTLNKAGFVNRRVKRDAKFLLILANRPTIG
jgi:hypothetical protein